MSFGFRSAMRLTDWSCVDENAPALPVRLAFVTTFRPPLIVELLTMTPSTT